MNKRIFTILITIILGLVVTQGIGLLPREVAAAPGDFYSPFDLAYSPDGSMIAVSDLTKARLVIITASTGSIARTVALNGQPKGLAWSGNTRLYVAEYDAGSVAEVDPGNGSILRRFWTGRKPIGVAVASGKLVVTDFGLKKATVVDLTSGSIGDVSVKDYPYFVEATTTGAYAIIGHATPSGNAMSAGYASSITFVDVNARTVAANFNLPTGSGNVRKIKCSPDGQWAYVLHTLGRIAYPTTQITKGWVNTDALTIINVGTRSIYTTVLLDTLYEGAADPWGLAISSDSNTLWITISGTHQVFKVDLYNLHQLLNGNIPGGGSGTYYNIVNRNSGKCLDVYGNSMADGGQLIQWPSNGGDNQKWQVVEAGGGYKKLLVKSSGKYADNQGSSTQGAVIVQWSSSSSNNQQWTMTDRGGGYFSFTCRTGGLAMDIASGSTADGANVVQNSYSGAASQQWQLVPAGGGSGGTLTFRSKAAYPKPYSDIWFAIQADSSKRALLKNNLGALWSAGLLTKIKLPGQGPRGISVSSDGTKVAVGSYFAGEVYIMNTSTNAITQTISLGTQPAEDSVRRGERTFYDASTTTQKWLSCASCHPEGRADGFNWDMPNDGVGNSKNAKTMYKAFEISPVMWRGIRPDAATGVNAGFKFIKFRTPTQQELDDVGAYIQAMAEDVSPYRNADGTMTADALAGKTLFQSSGTQCANCHSGTNLTDCAIHDVGTKDANDIDGNYVTPPIEEMWRTAPYLHDGSAPTMRDVLTTRNVSDRHGVTSNLTSTQIDQLAAFLLQVRPGELGASTPAPATSTPTPTPTATPIPGGTGTGLTGEYYDNMDFTSLKVTRTDATVNFDWGTGSPDASVGVDSFTVRWTGQVQPRYSETYSFYINTDDGVRLWVNNQLLVDKWVDQGPTEWSGTIALSAGQKYNIKMEYYENGGGAVAKLSWSSGSQSKEIIPQSQLYPGCGTGLNGEYYDNMDLTSWKLTRTDATVNFDWGSGSPDASIGADTYSARWTGQVQPRYSETYTFYTTTDDGVRLWVNNQLLVDKWIDQGPTEWSGTIALSAGQKYEIKMEYYENGGGASAKLSWSSASQAKEIIPQSQLYPTGNVALNKTASADSQQAGNEVYKGNDGNTGTRWCANDGGLNHWWRVDLGSSYNLTGSEVNWEMSGKVYKYKIETSPDDANWTLKVDKTNNTSTAQIQADSFSGTARYVRITVTGLDIGCWNSFWEFKVFGY